MADRNAGRNPRLEEEEDDSFEEVDMIEVLDDEDDDDFERAAGTDQGDLGDDEVEDDEVSTGPGLEGFNGTKPDYILTAHMGSAIFCVSFDSVGHKLITGGEDDVANVWDSTSIKTHFPIFKCKGHADSIVSASFSWDSAFFSTCDMGGMVKVWKTSTYENVITFETGDLSWSFWHTQSNILFAGTDDGCIYMWKIPTGDCKLFDGPNCKCECGTLLPDGKSLAAGYADGGVKIFDLKSGDVLHQFAKHIPIGDQSAVISIDRHPRLNIVATGSSDGTVKLYSTQNAKLITIWQCTPGGTPSSEAVDDDKAHSVETVAFYSGSQFNFLAAGSVTGHMVIWDVTLMIERFRILQEVGLTKLIWDKFKPIVYAGGMDGAIRAYDARSCQQESILGRHRCEVLDLAITKDGTKLASGSEDGSAFIYNLKEESSN